MHILKYVIAINKIFQEFSSYYIQRESVDIHFHIVQKSALIRLPLALMEVLKKTNVFFFNFKGKRYLTEYLVQGNRVAAISFEHNFPTM